MTTTKACSKCKEVLPLTSFYKRHCKASKSGLQSHCKTCWGKYRKSKYDPALRKDQALKKLYGISLKDYEEMYKKQDGSCLICTDEHDTLVVDHCHDTGEVRGLLCHNCNVGIGMFKHNDLLLKAAGGYCY